MALWYIAGKAARKPFYELLGGKVRDSIETKWSVTGVDPDKAADIAQWAVDHGFRAMKVKVAIDPAGDLARVRAVRKAIGSDIKLGIDTNGGWSPDQAVTMMKRLAENKVYFAEQPVAPEELALMATVRKNIPVPIIADESIYSLQDAMTLYHLGAADVFSIYVGKAGGIGPSRKIARFAATVGLKCTVGSNLELGVGTAAMAHLAVATHSISPEDFPCDIIGPLYYEDDVVKEPIDLVPGLVRLSARPGLGVELDESKVERYRVH
jgi:muconate cycloisomerase